MEVKYIVRKGPFTQQALQVSTFYHRTRMASRAWRASRSYAREGACARYDLAYGGHYTRERLPH